MTSKPVHFLHILLGNSHQYDGLNSGKIEFYESVLLDCSQEVKYSVNESNKCENNLLCILNVPSYMIPGEIIKFFGLDLRKITSFRIYRHYSDLDIYTAVLQIVNVLEMESIITDYDGQLMSTLEGNTFCRLRPIKQITFTKSSDFYRIYSHNKVNGVKSVGKVCDYLPKIQGGDLEDDDVEESCPVCLESVTDCEAQTFTTCCRHTFHVSCIAKLEGPQCPVCR
jgi:hypothetical protein